MINESEMKSYNAKNEKWDLLCKPNTARPRAKKAAPRVCCSVALLRRGVNTVHRGKIFGFLFRKSCIRAPIVWDPNK